MARSDSHRLVRRSTLWAFVSLVLGVVAILALVTAALLAPIRELSRIGEEHARAVSVASRLRGRLSELRREVVSCAVRGTPPRPPGSADGLLGDVRPAAEAAGVALAAEVPAGVRAAIEPEHLRVVLANLVGNAVRYVVDSPGPRVTITGREREGAVEIAVADTGPGIPAEALPHVFEPFFRASGKPGGFGLGLATVQQIVVAYSGRVAVQSSREGGTTFVVELPRAKGPALSIA